MLLRSIGFYRLPPRLRAMTNAQTRLIHELVEQSRDRVAHVRAGQSLAEVLDNQGLHGPPTKLPVVTVALARKNDSLQPVNSHDASGMRASMRKRAAIAAPQQHQPMVSSSLQQAQSSYTQYAPYAGSKLMLPHAAVNAENRRKAVFSSTKQLNKLADMVKKKEAEASAASASAATKLKRAVAVMKTKHVFLQANGNALRPQHVPDPSSFKNTHLAFLEFKQESRIGRRPRDAGVADVRTMNASTKEPLRFGDAVCLMSMAANVPVAIGRNGRAMSMNDSATGPHMIFTIIDFANPSRRDNVLSGEAFWLQVDTKQLDHSKDEDEILALLVDTKYYLGCPGWVEEEATSLPAIVAGPASKYHSKPKHEERHLRLIAMKATIPSTEYYGDDRATREYTIETNPSIMRLAKWHFAPVHHHTCQPQSENHLLVHNCAVVSMMQGEFALEFDMHRRRAALLDATKRGDDGTTLAGDTSDHHDRKTCLWQVRLIHREASPPQERGAVNAPSGKSSATALPSSPVKSKQRLPTEKESLAWLQFHTAKVESTKQWIEQKRVLARDARKAYDKVTAQSNAKLLQIEDHKVFNHREYFQRLMQELEEHNQGGQRQLPRMR